ncbi:MAG: ROK family protein [Clostridia bacterium]|nr:ROK family protein [Clostridia bacterium]MBR4049833.1 ROK family protein [Clostridia bacterium]
MDINITNKSDKIEFLSKYFAYIEAIRHYKVPDKTTLKNLLGVAWPTLQNAIKDFDIKNSPIKSNSEGFFLDRDFSIHAGISIGATQIKLYLCNFDFEPLTESYFESIGLKEIYKSLKQDDVRVADEKSVDEGYFCYNRENSVDGIAWRLKKIFDCLIQIDNQTQKLLSVGISFPGIINKDNLRIDFSPNIKCLRNVFIKDLLSIELWKRLEKNEISVFFEHDTQAASIYEKEALYCKSEKKEDYSSAKNVCCVYIAAGIGASLILNNKLCRGGTNSFGEFGHTPAPDLLVDKIQNSMLSIEEFTDKFSYEGITPTIEENQDINSIKKVTKHISPCECGKIACLESAFRRNVFDSYDLDNYLERINNQNELKNFNETHPYRYRVLKEYIGYMIGLLINFFNPDIIIFSGRIVWEISQLHNELNTIKANSAIGIPAQNCNIILGTQKIYSAAAGTAISSYHSLVNGDSFCDICW